MLRFALFLCVAAFASARAQKPAAAQPVPPIQDNSFLVEEAYNQEGGVVQHISAFARSAITGTWGYSFTQEWPVSSVKHQVSYTVPVMRVDETPGSRAGVGDVLVHYRYQLVGTGAARVALAPRLSAVIPTGSSRRGLGTGGPGVQVNLPLSILLPRSLVAHSNAGATYTARAHDTIGGAAATMGYNVAQSVVWLVHPKFNVMLESTWNRREDVVGAGQTASTTEVLLSPGVRAAFDLPSGLQIVPGLAVPLGLGPSRGDRYLFLYLSFEHPFAASGR